jgi:FkbM family methyltransferase
MTFTINVFLGKLFKINIRKNNNSFEAAQRYLINEMNIDLLIDGGANTGQYARRIRGIFKGNLLCIEPIKDNFNRLLIENKNDSKFYAANVAVGPADAVKKFYVSNSDGMSSSIYKPKKHLIIYPEVTFEKIATVKMTRIDSMELAKKSESIYLKLDLQGYELPALKGATKLFKTINIIEIEISFIEGMYENEASYLEMLNFLNKSGYHLYSISDFRRTRNGQIVYADLLFTRLDKINGRNSNFNF